MSDVLCDKRVPPHVKGKLHKMIVQQLCCTDGDSASHQLLREETGSERNEDVQMGMRPHTKTVVSS